LASFGGCWTQFLRLPKTEFLFPFEFCASDHANNVNGFTLFTQVNVSCVEVFSSLLKARNGGFYEGVKIKFFWNLFLRQSIVVDHKNK